MFVYGLELQVSCMLGKDSLIKNDSLSSIFNLGMFGSRNLLLKENIQLGI